MDEILKECFKCGEVKPITDFYHHDMMGDGHLNKCKECTKTDVKSRYHGDKHEEIKAYDRKRHSDPLKTMLRIWKQMIKRCVNPEDNSYYKYGSRGISVCDRWSDRSSGFTAFIADMGMRPSKSHSVDRIDTNGNYEPSNCRWATATQQSRNTRSNRMVEYRGKTKCLAQWVEDLGLDYGLVNCRLNRGWTFDRAISEPKRGSVGSQRYRMEPKVGESRLAPKMA